MRKRALKSRVSRLVHTGLSIVLILTTWPSAASGAESHAQRQKNISVSVEYYVDWGSGACGEALVTNHGPRRIKWEACIDTGGVVTAHWNSKTKENWREKCPQNPGDHAWRFVGAGWNRKLKPGASTTPFRPWSELSLRSPCFASATTDWV